MIVGRERRERDQARSFQEDAPLLLADPAPSNRSVPTYENVCAVVVTYCPGEDLLVQLRSVQSQVRAVVIVDNGSSEESFAFVRQAQMELGSHVIRNDVNRGIAAALNQGANWAAKQGFSWLLILDQDTVIPNDFLISLVRTFQEFPLPEKIAVIASNYKNQRSSDRLKEIEANQASWTEVTMAISSGSLLPLCVFLMIGPFREDFFIDGVDFEYCLRARCHGFKVILSHIACTEHSIGNATPHRLPFRSKMVLTTNHPPVRRYYMARNQLILARQYFWREPLATASMLYGHLKTFALMVIFEKQVIRKLYLAALGVWDGLLGNLGRNIT